MEEQGDGQRRRGVPSRARPLPCFWHACMHASLPAWFSSREERSQKGTAQDCHDTGRAELARWGRALSAESEALFIAGSVYRIVKSAKFESNRRGGPDVTSLPFVSRPFFSLRKFGVNDFLQCHCFFPHRIYEHHMAFRSMCIRCVWWS